MFEERVCEPGEYVAFVPLPVGWEGSAVGEFLRLSFFLRDRLFMMTCVYRCGECQSEFLGIRSVGSVLGETITSRTGYVHPPSPFPHPSSPTP
jgi:hypothetical protein